MNSATKLFCRRCGVKGAGADGFCPTCHQNALLRRRKHRAVPIYWVVAALAIGLAIALFVLVSAVPTRVAVAPAVVAERQVGESSLPPEPDASHAMHQETPLPAKATIKADQQHQDAPATIVTQPNAQPELQKTTPARQPDATVPDRHESATPAHQEPAIPPTPQDVPQQHKQTTPPAAPASKLDRLKRSGQYITGTGKELADIGPQLAEQKISLIATVTSMSNAFAGDAGITDLVSKDGAMKIRVHWNHCPRGLREYFALIKQRKGNELSLQGVVESYDDGLCIVRVEHYQER